MNKQLWIIALLLSVGIIGLVVSCSEETETLNLDYGYDYFPIETGFWVTYQVDSVIYSSFAEGGVDTSSIELREDIVESFMDNEGRPAVTLERRIRPRNSQQAWENIIPTVWYMVRTEDRAERIEGNLRFMNLTFPVLESRKWAGNTYINTDATELAIYADWQYQYQEIGASRTINGLDFGETVRVIQNNYDDYVDKIYSEEVYAKGVGLVYKEQWILKIGAGTDLKIPCCRCRCSCIHAPPNCECDGQQLSLDANLSNCAPHGNEGGCSDADIAEQCPWPDNAGTGRIITYQVLDYKK